MIETQLQHQFVMDFLCRKEDGLQYREVKNNLVNDELFIPSDLKEFVRLSSPDGWRRLVQKKNGEEEALAAIISVISDRILSAGNVATFFNSNKTVTVDGESITLLYVSGSELSGDAQFEKNIFSCVEEVTYTFRYNGVKQFTIRPDVSFFLNGIFLGYMELKSQHNRQTAREHGRDKIITDYLEALIQYTKIAGGNDIDGSLRRQMFRIFEKSIHLTASDIYETFCLRGLQGLFADLRKQFTENTITVAAAQDIVRKLFKEYPLTSPELGQEARFREVMTALYSKKMIEKEILYYNFLSYTYERKTANGKKGKKQRTSNTGYLIAPRPKQKFGCDKIMRRVDEFMRHETEPNYYTEQLRQELTALGAQPEKIAEIIAEHDKYSHNKYVYSLLLQYAAGFGKSNIIGWTAQQLKDLRYQGKYAYDKIFIVVDRLQLRDQTDTMMRNMNIDNSMFLEVTDKDTFVKALTGEKERVYIVNIQKFSDITEELVRQNKQVKPMRVAFLIDEIHRSNTGETHEEMMSVFDDLADSLETAAQEAPIPFKNLIVGFTATPSEQVLARFGEYHYGKNVEKIWQPFDVYTMKEAIEDGYILDPTKNIITVTSSMHFDLTPEVRDNLSEEDKKKAIASVKEKIYSNPERMQANAKFIVQRLVSLVYGKIHGQGKAMLAVSSIPNAIAYCNMIRVLMAEMCASKKQYETYKDAPIAIVYSDNQKYQSSAQMNGGLKEEEVIQNFKLAKNGLIIVVDKLQTGFDEPKLHTLFLDKEITDINAIQTISRVNRTTKYKEECHIIDMSYNNVNVENIREAFKKFSDMVLSTFDPKVEAAKVEALYKSLTAEYLYKNWFARFKSEQGDISFIMQFQDAIRHWVLLQLERAKSDRALLAEQTTERVVLEDEAKKLRTQVGQYASAIETLRGVIELQPKYTDEIFQAFWAEYCAIYLQMMESEREHGIPVDVEFDSIGFTGQVIDEGDDGDGGKEGPKPPRPGGKSRPKPEHDLFEMLEELNRGEAFKAEEIMMWRKDICDFFENLKQNAKLLSMLEDDHDNFSREDKQREYGKTVRKYLRQVDARPEGELFQPRLFKDMVNNNKDQFYFMFIDYLAGGDVYDYYQVEDNMPLIPFDDVLIDPAMYGENMPRMVHKNPAWRNVALAVRQPWASLLCCGIKDIENRSWTTDYRGRLFIVASATNVSAQLEEDDMLMSMVQKHINSGVLPPLHALQTSAVIGYVDLVDCSLEPSNSFWSIGAWDSHNVNWVIKNAYIFDEPQLVGIKGKLNLFEIPELDPDNLPPAHRVNL